MKTHMTENIKVHDYVISLQFLMSIAIVTTERIPERIYLKFKIIFGTCKQNTKY